MKEIKKVEIKKVSTQYELVKDFLVLNEIRENSKIISEVISYIGPKPKWIRKDDSFHVFVAYVKDINTFKEFCKTRHFTDIFTSKNKDLFVNNNFKTYFSKNKYNPENFVLFYTSDHMIFNYKIIPITTQYWFTYIGGFDEKVPDDKNYKDIIYILKKHKYTTTLEEAPVESYNADFNYQMGVSNWRVTIPQELYEKLWKYCCASKNLSSFSMYPSTRLKELISGRYPSKFDIYGIDKLVKVYNATEQYNDSEID